jgi:hypothetical protein
MYVVGLLKVDELTRPIPGREAAPQAVAVFPDTPLKITRHAYVQRARVAGKDIDGVDIRHDGA